MIVLIVRSCRANIQRLAGTVRVGVQRRWVNFSAPSSTASATPEGPAALGYPGGLLLLISFVLTAETGTDPHREQHHQSKGRVGRKKQLPHRCHLVGSTGFII